MLCVDLFFAYIFCVPRYESSIHIHILRLISNLIYWSNLMDASPNIKGRQIGSCFLVDVLRFCVRWYPSVSLINSTTIIILSPSMLVEVYPCFPKKCVFTYFWLNINGNGDLPLQRRELFIFS